MANPVLSVQNPVLSPTLETANQQVEVLKAAVNYLAAIQMANQNHAAHLNRIVKVFGMISIGSAITTFIHSYLSVGQETRVNELADRIGALEKAKYIKK